MGMPGPCSSSSYDPKSTSLPNPNPNRFRIVNTHYAGAWAVLEVVYWDCTNFEGRKILVMPIESAYAAVKEKKLDPHFSDDEGPSPVARFEPSERGWGWAVDFAERLALQRMGEVRKSYLHAQ